MSDFPDTAPARAPWLVTLADLALLLLGFMVLIHATAEPRRAEVARSLRDAFGPEQAVMPVAAYAVRFAPGSAVLADPAPLLAWAQAELRDPRIGLTVTAATEGTASDVDPASGGAAPLAADRARAVAVALAGVAPPERLRLATDPTRRGRTATLTLAFVGEPASGTP